MKEQSPIGVFDSGYGGITVLLELKKVLPQYDYLYLGDNARAPYGTKSFDVVLEHTWEGVQKLFQLGCELVILACNTASAKALRTIQQQRLFEYPNKRVLGVIRPSAEIVGAITRTGEIGVLATEGTVKSCSYEIEIRKFFPEVNVSQMACPLWVPLIENNRHWTDEGKQLIFKDMNTFLKKYPNVDAIVLGCTHYPILLPLLEDIVPKNIVLISQGELVAKSLLDYLCRHQWMESKLSKSGTIQFFTSESAEIFNDNVLNIFHIYINAKKISLPWH
ncbi:MAG: glutamate racemase [Crocinitomicaceae bacterium]|nr:glutamate racemase [Crocinitomicaceae bacterium]